MDTSDFLCPISREIMQDPVIAADGHTYEREMISGASWALRARVVRLALAVQGPRLT